MDLDIARCISVAEIVVCSTSFGSLYSVQTPIPGISGKIEYDMSMHWRPVIGIDVKKDARGDLHIANESEPG